MADLYKKLPEEFLPETCVNPQEPQDPKKYLEAILKKELPRSDSRNLEKDLNWTFLLDKHSCQKKKLRPVRRKKTFLTRSQRKELDILKLPKSGWSYQSLAAMREKWKKYVKENLGSISKAPSCTDKDWQTFSTVLARSELIGSEIMVVRSKVPSQVGITGTVVLESKMTFQIVTPQSYLKTIVKDSSVFQFFVNSLKITVFGKHLVMRPGDRSVKKIKGQMKPDL